MTGAPGSKWSSVARSIYWSKDVDSTDYSDNRTYHIGHCGAYWDPGMEFNVDEWDKPFNGKGKRIIKSHTFANNLDFLKFDGSPIILVYRNDYECMNWWLEAGGFDITYPNYKPYYKNEDKMWNEIQRQNSNILKFLWQEKENVKRINNSKELSQNLNITFDGCIDQVFDDKEVYIYKDSFNVNTS